MTDADALYAAVLAAPDDDTPRLAFADYLDDTGDRMAGIRARFIRNQVALARAEPWSDEYDTLYRATAPVEYHYAKAWAADTEGTVFPQGHVFARGFLHQITCYSKTFVSRGAALFDRHPVRAVKFAALNSNRGVAGRTELAACPALARLHTLTLYGTFVEPGYVDRVAASPHAAGVRVVTLGGGHDLLRAVSRAGPAWFPALAELEVWSVDGGADGALALARSKRLAGLTALRLCHNSAGPAARGPGAVALAESPHLRGLVELELRYQELRKRGAEAFAAAYAWPGLKRLGLRGNGIPASALPALAANPRLASLAVLDLRGNDVKAADLAPLREAFPHLRVLTDDAEHPIRLVLQPEDEP